MRKRLWTRFDRSKSMGVCVKTYTGNEIMLNDYVKKDYIYWELTKSKHKNLDLINV